MNIVEMHTYCDEFLDKADAPWFNAEQKDVYLNVAQREFILDSYKRFEIDENAREELSTLVRVMTFGAVSQIDLTAIPKFTYVLNLNGDFPSVCGSGVTKRSIKAETLDDIVENQNDPFNLNDDENPGYIQFNNGTVNLITIQSATTPTAVSLYYLKDAIVLLNDETTPSNNVDCELPEFTHQLIVDIACRKMLGTLQDQIGYQFQENEINKNN